MIEFSENLLMDFEYELPQCFIADFPVAERDLSKLLIYKEGIIKDDLFSHLSSHQTLFAIAWN